MVAVYLGADLTEFMPERALQWHVKHLDHGDVGAGGARRGGDFRADEPAADRDQPGSRLQGIAHADRVVDGPQVHHPLAGDAGQHPRAAAGGEQDAVRAHGRPVGEQQAPAERVESRHRHADAQVHRIVGAPWLVYQNEVVGLLPALQKPLGQRGTLVGQVRLVPDDGDGAVEPASAQCAGCHSGDLATADDRHGPRHGEPSVAEPASRTRIRGTGTTYTVSSWTLTS